MFIYIYYFFSSQFNKKINLIIFILFMIYKFNNKLKIKNNNSFIVKVYIIYTFVTKI